MTMHFFRWLKPISIPISLILGSSCSPNTQFWNKPITLPKEWKSAAHFPVASPRTDVSRWWTHFNDPTLCQLITTGIQNSPTLEQARARVQEARARQTSETAGLFPQLTAGLSGSSRRNDSNFGSTSSQELYAANLNASWDTDLFGKRHSSIEAAAANFGVAEENVHSAQVTLASEIAANYVALRAAEARLSVLQRNVSTRENTNQLAAWRRQAGTTDALDASQAASSMETARAGIPALQQTIEQTRNRLCTLCGQNPGSLQPTLSANTAKIPKPPSAMAVKVPVDALRQRPDVRVAGYQVMAATAATRSADAARYPSLTLSGSLGLNAKTPSGVLSADTMVSNVAANLAAPIFNAGRLKADLDAARAVRDQSLANYRSTVLTALGEAENAMVACNRSGQRCQALARAADQAREADRLAQLRYKAGEIDLATTLDTQRSLLTLEESLLNARADQTTAYIRLYQAMGGGWTR